MENKQMLMALIELLLKSENPNTDSKESNTDPFIGKKVILRCDRSGVYFGTLIWRTAIRGRLENARRLWSWEGALDTFDLASKGTSEPKECKFSTVVELSEQPDVLDFILCSEKAVMSLESVSAWEK